MVWEQGRRVGTRTAWEENGVGGERRGKKNSMEARTARGNKNGVGGKRRGIRTA